MSLRNSKVVSTALGAQKLKYLLAVKDNKNEYTYEQKTLLNPTEHLKVSCENEIYPLVSIVTIDCVKLRA